MTHLRQLVTLAAALVVGGTMIGGTTAHAQTAGGYYVAVPAGQPAKQTLVTRETLWKLRGNAYVAARAPERDTFLCSAVVRDAGALSSFTVGGQAFDADQLAKCNAKARGAASGAAVAQAR